MCGFGAARDCNLVGRCNLAHTPACMQAQSLLLPKQRSPPTCIWAWSEGEVGYPYIARESLAPGAGLMRPQQ